MTTRLRELSAEVRALEAKLREGGGPDKIARQHTQRKLTARALAEEQLACVDATDSLSDYVSFGSDLADAETRPMLSLGGGVAVPVTQKLLVDVQYRYGRIFSSNTGINTNRAGVGFGFRF